MFLLLLLLVSYVEGQRKFGFPLPIRPPGEIFKNGFDRNDCNCEDINCDELQRPMLPGLFGKRRAPLERCNSHCCSLLKRSEQMFGRQKVQPPKIDQPEQAMVDHPQQVVVDHSQQVVMDQPEPEIVDQVQQPQRNEETDLDLQCGQRAPSNATTIETEDYPWMISVLKLNEQSELVYQCAGSLIHFQVVFTTAKCVFELPSGLTARGGDWKSTNAEAVQNRLVEEVFIHDAFDLKTLSYNIALLLLKRPFKVSFAVNTICLPASFHGPLAFYDCRTSFWNEEALQTHDPALSNMRIEHASIEAPDECDEMSQGYICNNNQPPESCQGDDGSPVVCRINGGTDDFYLAGMMAGGKLCHEKHYPVIFMSAPFFRDWIDGEMTDFKFSSI